MVKVFRLVQPGVNPDVELHAALAERECPAVAALRGWVELDDDTVGDTGAGPTTLAMAQEFMAGAADGWAMATASVRDLFAEADLLAEEVGTDFADESFRLGAAVAQVHEDLAAATGVGTLDGTDLVASMRARLDAAARTGRLARAHACGRVGLRGAGRRECGLRAGHLRPAQGWR